MRGGMELTEHRHILLELSNEQFVELQKGHLELDYPQVGVVTTVLIVLSSNMVTCACCGDRLPKDEPCECAFDTCSGKCHETGLHGRKPTQKGEA
jgi:hypothetical protein